MWPFFSRSESMMILYCLFIYLVGIGDPILRGALNLNNIFNPIPFVCLSYTTPWISSVICSGIFVLNCLRWLSVFVHICRIVHHPCLNILFIIISCHKIGFLSDIKSKLRDKASSIYKLYQHLIP